ncbi:hypothetical protein [Catenulispora rubra]|uniref:hypothetical protein n=1 Tax=Catenulispora rubra TaxID=280293 RepID=UPI0018924062|nr:hypothetical protein [Catenulispora rubra]
MSYVHVMAAFHQATTILADPISNPAPADPTGGAKGVNLLLSYAKWGALIACAISAVVSGGIMGVGSLSNRPDSVDKGKRALIWSLGGVLTCAIAIPLVNQVFGAAA